MSRSRHQKRYGRDYGGKYKVDRHYGCPHGKEGKKLASKERRAESKDQISNALF